MSNIEYLNSKKIFFCSQCECYDPSIRIAEDIPYSCDKFKSYMISKIPCEHFRAQARDKLLQNKLQDFLPD